MDSIKVTYLHNEILEIQRKYELKDLEQKLADKKPEKTFGQSNRPFTFNPKEIVPFLKSFIINQIAEAIMAQKRNNNNGTSLLKEIRA